VDRGENTTRSRTPRTETVASTESHPTRAAADRVVLGCAGDILWVPGGEHGERDLPKVTALPLDPDIRKEER
jgi:hypothetical protein